MVDDFFDSCFKTKQKKMFDDTIDSDDDDETDISVIIINDFFY
mgnify:CR=1 FL=1